MLRLAASFLALLTISVIALPAQAQRAADWWTPVAPRAETERGQRGDDTRRGDRRTRRKDTYDRRPYDRRSYDERYDERSYDNRSYDKRPYHKRKRGSGPPFCRNGNGHPVHGWSWCVEKGFAAPHRPYYRPQRDRRRAPRYRWRHQRGTSISFRISYERMASWNGVLTRADLQVIFDRSTLRRLYDRRDRLGIRAPIEGRWVRPRNAPSGRILQLRAGRTPLAELADWDGDRRVEAVWTVERTPR
jgi:hypothetical protein